MVRAKISETDKIHIENLLERASEIVEPCINCGLCKNSSMFNVTKEEGLSPRGFANLLKEKKLSEDVFKSNLDGSCRVKCPFDIDVDEAILAAREAMFLKKGGAKKKAKKREN